MLGSLKPILDKLKPFNVKLQMFAHPTDYDRFPVCLENKFLIDRLLIDEFIEDGSRGGFRPSAGRQKSPRLPSQVGNNKIQGGKA